MRSGKGLTVPVIAVIGILMGVLSVVVVFSIQGVVSRFTPSYSSAERYLRQGKLNEAFAVTKKIREESPEKILLKGKIYLAKSCEKRKKNGWHSYGTDSADWLRGADVDSALSCFKKAHTLDGSAAVPVYFLGVVYKEKGWLQDAEDAFFEVLRLDPDNVDARVALGALFAMTDRHQEAFEQLSAAYRLSPEDPQVIKNIAFLYRFHKAVPESAVVWLNRYLDHAAAGDLDINLAKTELSDLLARYPEYTPEKPPDWQKNRRHFVPRNK